MNEILLRKTQKRISAFGIEKKLSREIAELALSIGNESMVDVYVEYALDYIIGRRLSNDVKCKKL